MNDPARSVSFDLAAYLRRIGYAGELSPSRATLDALHRAHATSIPFENLDILLGVPIRLDLPSLQAKLVAGRRGGYCFEQNALFASALEHLGFAVTRLAARVRYRSDRVLPRTHMALRVDVDGARLLVDVVEQASVEERTDQGLIKEKLRVELRRFFRKRSGRRPFVLPVIMEI